MKCINCNSIDIGKIGPRQYFCWNCCIEMNVVGDKLDVYQVEEDGSISSLNDLFFADETAETAESQITEFATPIEIHSDGRQRRPIAFSPASR